MLPTLNLYQYPLIISHHFIALHHQSPLLSLVLLRRSLIMATRVQTRPHPPSAPKRSHAFQRSPLEVNLLGLAERQEEEAKHRKPRVLRMHKAAPKKHAASNRELELLREEVRSLELRKVSIAGALTALSTYETAYTHAYRDCRTLERQRSLTVTSSRASQSLPNAEPLRLDNRVRLANWMSNLSQRLAVMTNEQRTQLLLEQLPEVTRYMKVRALSVM